MWISWCLSVDKLGCCREGDKIGYMYDDFKSCLQAYADAETKAKAEAEAEAEAFLRLWCQRSLMGMLSDPRHERVANWMTARVVGEQVPKTQVLLAEELGCVERTIRDWSVRDDVLDRRRELAIQLGGDPERVKQVMDALFREALDTESPKQVAAATAWAKIAQVIVPKEDGRKKAGVAELHDLGLSSEALQGLLNEAVKQAVPDVVPAEFEGH